MTNNTKSQTTISEEIKYRSELLAEKPDGIYSGMLKNFNKFVNKDQSLPEFDHKSYDATIYEMARIQIQIDFYKYIRDRLAAAAVNENDKNEILKISTDFNDFLVNLKAKVTKFLDSNSETSSTFPSPVMNEKPVLSPASGGMHIIEHDFEDDDEEENKQDDHGFKKYLGWIKGKK